MGFIKKKTQEKEKRRYVGRDVTKRKKFARVSSRGAACVLRKNDPKKIVQKSGAELKTQRKRRKSAYNFFICKKSQKKKRKRKGEVPLGIAMQQDHSSLRTLRAVDPTTRV